MNAKDLIDGFKIVYKYCGNSAGEINREEVETRLIFTHDEDVTVSAKDKYKLSFSGIYYVDETRQFILEL